MFNDDVDGSYILNLQIAFEKKVQSKPILYKIEKVIIKMNPTTI